MDATGLIKGIAVIHSGFELEGAKELAALGATDLQPGKRSIAFQADQACFYRLNLKARLPFRILREMGRLNCDSPEGLYVAIQQALRWEKWLDPSKSFRVDVSGRSDGLPHSHFTALQVKNALVDLQRKIWGERSNINTLNPDICLHVHVRRGEVVLSFDSSAISLHRRGYRSAMGFAPLKENLAAGLIRLTGWDGDLPLVDPMCGSATFLIEAASIALGVSPGLNRSFLFQAWPDFNKLVWNKEFESAKERKSFNNSPPLILGCEEDAQVAQHAQANISKAGLDNFIQIHNCHFKDVNLPTQKGVLMCNPPYGRRIGYNIDLSNLYYELGSFLKLKASGWDLWLLSGNPNLTRFLKLKSSRKEVVNNGGIDCRWINYRIN